MRMKGLSIGILLIVCGACKGQQDKGTKTESLPEAAAADQKKPIIAPAVANKPAEPAADSEFLLGKWSSDCINSPEGSLQASRIVQYEFGAGGTANFKEVSYRSANCTLRFTKPDVDALIIQINADRLAATQSPLNAQELDNLANLWFPKPNNFKFKLGRKLKDETIEIDSTVTIKDPTAAGADATKDVSTYQVLYFNEGLLYFAMTCGQNDYDANICKKIVGQIPTDRGRDLREAPPFHKI